MAQPTVAIVFNRFWPPAAGEIKVKKQLANIYFQSNDTLCAPPDLYSGSQIARPSLRL
jgi:hypothetical protein